MYSEFARGRCRERCVEKRRRDDRHDTPPIAKMSGGSQSRHSGSLTSFVGVGATKRERRRRGDRPSHQDTREHREDNSHADHAGAVSNASYAPSLATKPNVSGTPAIDSAAAPPAMAVSGIVRRSPDKLRMSRLPVCDRSRPRRERARPCSRRARRDTPAPRQSPRVVPTPSNIVKHAERAHGRIRQDALQIRFLDGSVRANAPWSRRRRR